MVKKAKYMDKKGYWISSFSVGKYLLWVLIRSAAVGMLSWKK